MSSRSRLSGPRSAEEYGDKWSVVYDYWVDKVPEMAPGEAVRALSELAKGRSLLEVGAGTGRLAIPLAERGLRVTALEASGPMLDRLRAKPHSDLVRVIRGDFRTCPLEGPYSVIVLAANTLQLLGTSSGQQQALQNLSGALEPKGVLVVEADMPQLSWAGRHLVVSDVYPGGAALQATEFCAGKQTIFRNSLLVSNGNIQVLGVHVRWTWPSELDLLAATAGLALHRRWSSWIGAPFDGSSSMYVSLYRRPKARR
jgi:SAM-dependent methyltransferase